VLPTLAAVLLIIGLGGLTLGLVWGGMAASAGEPALRKSSGPLLLGAVLVCAGWIIPADAPADLPEDPPEVAVGPIPADALLQPTPMVATHTRRAYALSASGKVSSWGEPIPDPRAAQGAVARIAVGREHLCILRPTGELRCWGEQREGQASPPGGTFIALASGTEHSCALAEDGEPLCWGRRDSRIDPPEGLVLRTLSSSDRHTCGLDAAGGAHCWGCAEETAAACEVPEDRFIQISAGHHHTCALASDLTVRCWGSNEAGQSTAPAGTFTGVTAGWTQTCALNTLGAIACWGCSGRLQALDPSQATHCQPPSGRFIAMSGGDIWGSCAMSDRDKGPTCWGGPARSEEPR